MFMGNISPAIVIVYVLMYIAYISSFVYDKYTGSNNLLVKN